MVSVTVAGCHTLLCVLGLALLATCRGSSSPLHSAGDTEPTTEQCTPRQAQLQALLFKQFDESTHLFSACPSQLWLDVYHRESTLPVNGPALLLHQGRTHPDQAETTLRVLAGLSPSRKKTFIDIGCNKVRSVLCLPSAVQHAALHLCEHWAPTCACPFCAGLYKCKALLALGAR